MGKKPPQPPDPKETSAAQTGTSVATSVANAYMGNVNQITPDGSLTYNQTGTHNYYDPYTEKSYNIPTWTATQTLSPEQQAIQAQTKASELNLAKIANDQSGRIGSLLGSPIDLSGAPSQANIGGIQQPNYSQMNGGPGLRQSAGSGGTLIYGAENAGRGIANGYGSGGYITRDIAGTGQGISTGIAGAGQGVLDRFGSAGDITKTYGSSDNYQEGVKRVEDAMFKRLNPQIDRQRSALETQLANQGVGVGSRAYQAAMSDFNEGINDQRTSVLLGSGQEQSRLAGLDQSRAGFQNAAQQQAYGQALGRGQFANAAQSQRFGQNAANSQFQNAAQAQAYGQRANTAGFQNAAQAQANSQNAGAAAFQNAAQGQAYGQYANNAALNNAAAGQQFQENVANAQLYNDAQQQMYSNQSGATQYNNSLQDQSFNSRIAQAQAQNSSRNNWMQEQFALRNQPINETTALLSGSQVTQPNFINAQMPTIPTTDNAGIIAKNYDQKLQGWQMSNAMTSNILGGLFGLGGSIIASDRRLKQDIKRIGTADNGLPIYSYRYKAGGPVQIGFMADEVQKIRPDAVAEIGGGFLGVDYEKAVAA